MKITLLGTSSFPTLGRNSQSTLIEIDQHTAVIVDCGEGTQRQLLRLGKVAKNINTIFLTHHHIDHLAGLPGLVIYLYKLLQQTITIVAPQQTLATCKCLIECLVQSSMGISIQYIEATENYLGSIGTATVRCFNTYHTDESLGYSFYNADSKITLCGDLTVSNPQQRHTIVSALAGSERLIIDIVHMQPEEALSLLAHFPDSTKVLLPVPFGRNTLLEDALNIKGTKILNDFDTF
ncbi:MAG: MBL fold metallo-hydrolase [Cellulosilyticaceae bacterium]